MEASDFLHVTVELLHLLQCPIRQHTIVVRESFLDLLTQRLDILGCDCESVKSAKGQHGALRDHRYRALTYS